MANTNVTAEPIAATYTVPDYARTQGQAEFVPTTYADTAMTKVLAIHHDARNTDRAYGRDVQLTSLFSDLIAWSEGEDVPSREFGQIRNRVQAALLPEEVEDLKSFFRLNANQLSDLLTQVDSLIPDTRVGRLPLTERREYVLEQAKFNQKLATAFFHAARLDATNPERIRIEAFVAFMRALDQRQDVNGLGAYREILNGALAQAGLMNWLDKIGCYIIVPDYEDDAEMLQTDIKGVDFVAVTPRGTLLLIDAKGRLIDTKPGERVRPPIIERDPDDIEHDHPARDLTLHHLEHVSSMDTRRKYPGINRALIQRSLFAPHYRIAVPTTESILHVGELSPEYVRAYSPILQTKFNL